MYPRNAFIVVLTVTITFFNAPKLFNKIIDKRYEVEEEYMEANRKYEKEMREWHFECNEIRKKKLEEQVKY